MMTIKEYKSKYGDGEHNALEMISVEAMDIMETILKGDGGTAIFQPTYDGTSLQRYLSELRDSIDRAKDDHEACDSAFDNAYIPSRRYKPEFSENDGDLSIDQYINGSRKPFEHIVEVIEDSKKAISIYIGLNVPWGDRERSYIKRAYEKVYQVAATCEAENRPCRVVGVINYRGIDERQGNKPLPLFITFKNYNDPIFPAIWAGISDNRVCNSLICLIAWLVFGTMTPTAGGPAYTSVSNYIGDDDDVIIYAERWLTE
jgi:hypothetical protein